MLNTTLLYPSYSHSLSFFFLSALLGKYIDEVLDVLEYLSQDKDNKGVCTYLSAYYKIAKRDVMEVCQ